MTLAARIKQAVSFALKNVFPDAEINEDLITVSLTKPEFAGDYTVVLFPFVKLLRMKPDVLGQQLGDYLVQETGLFTGFSIVAGFLNLTVRDEQWVSFLKHNYNNTTYGETHVDGEKVMIEYSSPNTNKPLHFGHLRNIFLGASLSQILKATGNQVVKANLINDRGIHICKSMIAWQHHAGGATPETSGIKGDHLVGDYYVKFNDELNKAVKPVMAAIMQNGDIPDGYSAGDKEKVSTALDAVRTTEGHLRNKAQELDMVKIAKFGDAINSCISAAVSGSGKFKQALDLVDADTTLSNDQKTKNKTELKKPLKDVLKLEEKIDELRDKIKDVVVSNTALMQEAATMLRKWEAGDPEVRQLWETMNGWVYKGFDVTYKTLGVSFDKVYHESQTYLLGKQLVEDGLKKGVLFKKENGSIWIDLKEDGLDEKLLLRGDGTSVYITQDLGTAKLKYEEFGLDKSVYVIADEQNYHMQVLQLILKRLGEPCADGIVHMSYGMVELPSGRMKSREGTVVDADDMVNEMVRLSREQTEAAGKTEGFAPGELDKLYNMIGLGALKFYLLRVEPKKTMIFDPKESISLTGFTATFIQYTHARICSILNKEHISLVPSHETFAAFAATQPLLPQEKELVLQLEQYPNVLSIAAAEYNPSELCNYSFQLSQCFNTFYDLHQIGRAENEEKKQLRLMAAVMTASVLRHSMGLLGIGLPEKM